MMIRDSDAENYLKAKALHKKYEKVIIDAVDNVIRIIDRFFGVKLGGWCTGDDGDFDIDLNDRNSRIYYERSSCANSKHMVFLDHDYRHCFPVSFLFMSEGEIIFALDQHKKRNIEEILKESKSDQSKQLALKETALKKLTPEEKKALGIK